MMYTKTGKRFGDILDETDTKLKDLKTSMPDMSTHELDYKIENIKYQSIINLIQLVLERIDETAIEQKDL